MLSLSGEGAVKYFCYLYVKPSVPGPCNPYKDPHRKLYLQKIMLQLRSGNNRASSISKPSSYLNPDKQDKCVNETVVRHMKPGNVDGWLLVISIAMRNPGGDEIPILN